MIPEIKDCPEKSTTGGHLNNGPHSQCDSSLECEQRAKATAYPIHRSSEQTLPLALVPYLPRINGEH